MSCQFIHTKVSSKLKYLKSFLLGVCHELLVATCPRPKPNYVWLCAESVHLVEVEQTYKVCFLTKKQEVPFLKMARNLLVFESHVLFFNMSICICVWMNVHYVVVSLSDKLTAIIAQKPWVVSCLVFEPLGRWTLDPMVTSASQDIVGLEYMVYFWSNHGQNYY